MLNKKEIKLNAVQLEKKKKMLLDMKSEFEKLEYQRKHVGVVKFKIHLLRLWKILLFISKRISPYIASYVISFIILLYFNRTPFIQDKLKKKLEIQKEFDSLGKVRYEMQYDQFNDSNNEIKVFSEWNKLDDEFYEREIKVYSADKMILGDLEKLIYNNVLNLDEVLGSPTIVKKERRNNLSQEEINSPSFVQAVVYSLSKNDTIQVLESTNENLGYSLLWLFTNVFINVVLFEAIHNPEKEGLLSYIQKVNEEYSIMDSDEFDKLINIKRDNYNRMVK